MFRKVLGCLFAFCAIILLGLALLFRAAQPQQQSTINITPAVELPAISKSVAGPAANDYSPRLEPNLLKDGAVSDGRTYSVSLIDENENKIPTGTELFVQGTLYTAKWGPTDDCTRILAGRHVIVQHGEVDPAIYCRFSIVLVLQLYFLQMPLKRQESGPEGLSNLRYFSGLKPTAPSGIFDIQL